MQLCCSGELIQPKLKTQATLKAMNYNNEEAIDLPRLICHDF